MHKLEEKFLKSLEQLGLKLNIFVLSYLEIQSHYRFEQARLSALGCESFHFYVTELFGGCSGYFGYLGCFGGCGGGLGCCGACVGGWGDGCSLIV